MKTSELIEACGGVDSLDLRWNLYCVANGNQPARQRELDSIKWPADALMGYVAWVREHMKDFLRENPLVPPESFDNHRRRFESYLAEIAIRSYEAVLTARDRERQPIECVGNAS
jgi:hypothetical protein